MLQVNLAEDIYYLGFNDRRTNLFENIWPIPHGISYSSYLIVLTEGYPFLVYGDSPLEMKNAGIF